MWSLATLGSHSCFCSSEPKVFSGSGRPIDWCAESSVAIEECQVPARLRRLVVVDLREAEAAVLLGDLHPERAEVLEALDDVVGDLRVVLDLLRVDPLGQERAEALEELLALGDALGVDLRLRMDEVELEVAEVHAAAEAGLLPLGVARLLGDLLGLFVGRIRVLRHDL